LTQFPNLPKNRSQTKKNKSEMRATEPAT